MPRLRFLLAGAAAAALAGCAAADAPEQMSQTPQTRPGAAATPAPVDQTFAGWRADFRARALAQNISPEVFDAAFAGVTPSDRVLELDAFQPEFTRPIWEYLDSAVSDTRIANGRREASEKAALLDRIEAAYGVDKEAVVAIWGLESAYGANYGSIPVIRSLATLAWDGRRRDFAEAQLVSALRILEAGDVTAGRMVGSWAGAMGHTQFIPTSFEEYAVDFTGDGRRDLWAEDAADALASTANYLSRFGWSLGLPPAVEVRLPAGFDYALVDGRTTRSGAEWSALGVAAVSGILPTGETALIAPAGARGPAFAVTSNFRVIRRYNNSTSYALGVTHLADRIGGGGPIAQAWPRGDRPLSRAEKQEMQRRLTALGYDTQGVDGIIGPNSRGAIRAFQRAQGLTPDGYDSADLLAAIRAAGS
ncbi:MAG: lytic murein transglycosylase [Pseudomonadota bacterium]